MVLRSISICAKSEWRNWRSSMATPGQLVECIAAALNVQKATVVLYDRVLAEAGLRSKGGRGKSAAKVTAVDAANLLIGIAGSPASIGSAAEAVKQFSGLKYKSPGAAATFTRLAEQAGLSIQQAAERSGIPPEQLSWLIDEPDFLEIPGLEGLRPDHSFRDGLVALIESVRHGKISFREKTTGERNSALIDLKGPSLLEAVIMVTLDNRRYVSGSYKGNEKGARRSDLNWRQSFSHSTITGVAHLLALDDVVKPTKKKVA
jgi:hypothetical protein